MAAVEQQPVVPSTGSFALLSLLISGALTITPNAITTAAMSSITRFNRGFRDLRMIHDKMIGNSR